MGIVIRQSIKGTVVVYVGVILAFLVNLFFFPLCFTKEQIGLLKVLAELGVFIAALSSVGMQASAIFRFFPYFQNAQKGHHGFFWLITLIPLAGFCVFIILFYVFDDFFIRTFGDDSPLLTHYSYLLIPISLGFMLISTYETYSNAHLRIVVPKLIREVITRILIIGFCLLYLYNFIDFEAYTWWYVLLYIAAAFAIIAYLKWQGQLHAGTPISFPQPGVGKEITKYGTYMLMGSLSSLLINNTDILMIAASPNGDANNGIYLIAVLMASMIELPGRSIGQISAPIISEHMKNENYKEVQKLYKNSSIVQLSIGSLLFCLLWANIDNIYNIMPKGAEFEPAKYCVLFIGISQLFNMVTSLNGAVLGLSKHYKFGFYATVGLGIVSFFVNYLLIPRYGIIGAAVAKAINIFLYQSSILLFVYLKTGMHPFTNKTWLPVAIMGIAFLFSFSVPVIVNPYIDLIIRSIGIIGIFILFSLWFNVSPYFKELLDKGLQKARIKR